ncbi:pentatricopeptide repeat-containing protein At4g39530 [Cryptomeria japonica]|uniref:pentatricopeptide repeat-containing protein At4g39530 n=1 Tax=Cryptomeria japonica TaxID=3369 RepID=UPI0025AD5118|nr:pentatricopeptide repeat-containing protein At4g39530 [Cryptomeria japonica]
MYAKCANLEAARQMFDYLPHLNAVSWTAMISGYAQDGCLDEALQLFHEMPEPNVVTWTALISGYVQNGLCNEALQLFRQMQLTVVKPNLVTLASVLSACVSLEAVELGKEIHKEIVRSGYQFNVFLENGLTEMYGKSGRIDEARKVFDKMLVRNVISFNVMIAAYIRYGNDKEASSVFGQMQGLGIRPDEYTFSSLVSICSYLGSLGLGMGIHEDIIRRGFQSNVFVGNSLIDMYVKCGQMDRARKVFDKMPERDVVSWNVMTAGYAQNGKFDEALKLIEQMQAVGVKPDSVTWSVLIVGYTEHGNVDEALELFHKVPKRNAISWTAIIAGCTRQGKVNDARELFEEMPEKNVVAWTAMISGYAQNGCYVESLNVFQQMQLKDAEPNSVTFASVLPACANLAALGHGKEIHEDVIRRGFQSDLLVRNALVDMYAKCGSLGDARKVFDKIYTRDVISWNAMILGYAMHWCSKEALELFEHLQNSGAKPDHLTFVGVLSACSHAGLVDAGQRYFDSMINEYNIMPELQHYCCMVEILGRAGHLDQAKDFIMKMPIQPDSSVWRSLLSACRIHNNTQLGEQVAEFLLKSDPEDPTNYVLLSNMYAAAGKWNDAENVRKLMKVRQLKKTPGCSWIEVNNTVSVFLSGEISLP